MKSVAICITHWPNSIKRIAYLKQTLDALKLNLQFDVNICAACSVETETVDKELLKLSIATLHESAVTFQLRNAPANLGANMNAALKLGIENGAEFLVFLQDDWILTEKIAIAPYTQFLDDNPEFAMVRFSWPEIPEGDERSHWIIHDPTPIVSKEFGCLVQSIIRLSSKSTYFYGDQPHLRRANFPEQYGWFREGGDLGDPEVDLNDRLQKSGLQIATSHKVLFHHCGTVSSVTEQQRFGMLNPPVRPHQ